jgi:hypothetical protein
LLVLLLSCKDKEPDIKDIVVGTYDLSAVYFFSSRTNALCVKPFAYLFEENGKLNLRVFCPSSSTDRNDFKFTKNIVGFRVKESPQKTGLFDYTGEITYVFTDESEQIIGIVYYQYENELNIHFRSQTQEGDVILTAGKKRVN